MAHAESTFTIDSWDEQTWDEHDGVKLAKARVTKTWRGELEGTSVTQLLTVLTPVETSRAYFAVERFEGSVNGRRGSFVLQHSALSLPDAAAPSWAVMPEAASGELRGLTGTGEIVITPDGGHTFTLDYELPDDG